MVTERAPSAHDSAAPPPRWWRAMYTLAWAALLWLVANAVYVYIVLEGQRIYRLESATFILIALLIPLVLANGRRVARALTVSEPLATGLLALVLVLVLSTYVPLLAFPFLSDDYVFLGRYKALADLAHPTQFFRPLYNVVFLVLAKLGGGSSAPFHVASLALHLGSGVLVYRLARRLFEANGPALVAFAVFVLSPLQAEAVLWASGLQDALWTFFLLAALTCYTAAPRLTFRAASSTTALVALALLCKEPAVCFLILLPAADGFLFRWRRGPALLPAYASFAVTSGAYLLLRAAVVPMEAGYFVPPSRYFLTKFVTAPYRVFVQPWNASAITWPGVLACALTALVAVLVFRAVVHQRTGTRLLVGPAVILLSTLPVYSYFFVSAELAGARYLYFAAFGWALLVAELSLPAISSGRALGVTIAALALGLTALLHVNLAPWRVAGAFVDYLAAGIRAGRPPDTLVQEWQRRTGIALTVEGGVPRSYRGVGIFINGYPEFMQVTRGGTFRP
jgi:hypothetical protein